MCECTVSNWWMDIPTGFLGIVRGYTRLSIDYQQGMIKLLLLLLLLFTAIKFSLGGSSPYTSNK